MHENKIICHVCYKEIKQSQSSYCIGKDFSDKKLYRHQKCKPKGKVKIRKSWKKNPGTIIHKDKRKNSRQKLKIDLKKGVEK